MPILDLHHYKNQNLPYVAEIVSDGVGGTKQSFLQKVVVRKSACGTYGDYKCTVSQDGFYRIGNTKPEDGGYRMYYTDASGKKKFPFIGDPNQINDIKARIAHGESISQIVKALEL